MIKVEETDPVGDVEPKFPYRDVTIKRGVDAKEYYELLEEIGRGKFGTVYKCKEKATGIRLAAKFIAVPDRKERKNVEREIEMANTLQHPKIIQLYAAFEYEKMVCVVLELIDGGELFDRVLDDNYILTEKACSIFVRQICEALDFIHDKNVIHLDLKPENILCITQTGNRIKIIDFGLARQYDPDKKLQVLFGTPEFVAPEVVNFDSITFATDMWSVGVIAYVLVSGLSPFAGETDIDTMGNVTVGKYDFLDEAFDTVSPECIDFIEKLLKKGHGDRLTAKEALRHKWVKKKPCFKPKGTKAPPLAYSEIYNNNEADNKLNVATENLKGFVDRWNDSQSYVFDKEANSISPVTSTISSSIGNSTPSPTTGSLNSSTENLKPVSHNHLPLHSSALITKPSAQFDKSLKDYLQSFERRNSDSSFVLQKSPSADKMNLIDEIKKLTDHLFKLTTQQGPASTEQQLEHTVIQSQTLEDLKPNTKDEPSRDRIIDENNNVKTNKQDILDKKDKGLDNGRSCTETNVSDLFKKFAIMEQNSSQLDYDENAKPMNAPWPVSNKRTKFRINQMSSRDVPTYNPTNPSLEKFKKQQSMDTFSEISVTNTSSSSNQSKLHLIGEPRRAAEPLSFSANATKTCLLHLLEKYQKDTSMTTANFSSSRHFFRQDNLFSTDMAGNHHKQSQFLNGKNQSISFDWGLENSNNNIEKRTINSISTFFQLHANSGTNVKGIQAQIEAKNK